MIGVHVSPVGRSWRVRRMAGGGCERVLQRARGWGVGGLRQATCSLKDFIPAMTVLANIPRGGSYGLGCKVRKIEQRVCPSASRTRPGSRRPRWPALWLPPLFQRIYYNITAALSRSLGRRISVGMSASHSLRDTQVNVSLLPRKR